MCKFSVQMKVPDLVEPSVDQMTASKTLDVTRQTRHTPRSFLEAGFEAAVIGISALNRQTLDPREPIKASSSFEAAAIGIWALNRSTLDRFEHRYITRLRLMSSAFGP